MHRFTKLFFLFLILISKSLCLADNNLSSHLQVIVVTSSGWENQHGTMQLFERTDQNDDWDSVGAPITVILGKSGMAWGIGLYPLTDTTSSEKVEGDQKAPAGIFSLGSAFGFLPESQMTHLKIDYFQPKHSTVAVDDPLSRYYNLIVDSQEVLSDWSSCEKMREITLYEIGLVINHNLPDPKPGKGSAIFFHKWRHPNAATAGCTAMCQEDLETVLGWLEKNKNPVLIQMPYPVYADLQPSWNFPDLLTKYY